jgi:tetratricopeptide (TPR) repeat protein
MYDRCMPSTSDKASDLVESARRAFAAGDFANAEALYQDAIAAFPNSQVNVKVQVEAYIGLADCVDARGDDSRALRALARVIQGDAN